MPPAPRLYGMSWRDRSILMGFYLGIGDFLSAIPVVNELLGNGNRVTVAASKVNCQLAELVKFASHDIRMVEFTTFSQSVTASMTLLRKLSRLDIDHIFVSPHAQKSVSSWKLPIMLRMVSALNSCRPKIIGAADEKLSHLYNRRLDIDKNRNLVSREWDLHRAAGSIDSNREPDLDIFRSFEPEPASDDSYDLVIHPGASRPTKTWPNAYYDQMLSFLPGDTHVCFIGLPDELAPLKYAVTAAPNVHFRTGSIAEMVRLVAQAQAALTMDSGFSHVAAFLGVPHFALFGSTDPVAYAPASKRSTVLYRPNLPCQPCNLHSCPYRHIECMKQITPSEVAEAILGVLKTANKVNLPELS